MKTSAPVGTSNGRPWLIVMPAMSQVPPEERDKPPSARRGWRHKQLPAAYVAKIVSLRALRHFMQANGSGERATAWVAGQQLGVITRLQLETAGITRGAIESRVQRGLLHRVYRGVYLVGHPTPAPGAREVAALLACRPPALISHRSAAALWGLARGPAAGVEVTVVGRNCRSRDGLVVHRVEQLDRRDRATKSGILVTSPARTLVDFAAGASPGEIDRALAEAYALGLLTERKLLAAIDRAPGRAGVGIVRAFLHREAGLTLTRSDAERRLLKLVRAARLPPPLVNARVAGLEVDFLWPRERLIVEVDGYAYHGHRAAFERDRDRDAALVAAGYRVIRVTWRQIVDEPFHVVANIARALESRP